jgi:hypothetical protein
LSVTKLPKTKNSPGVQTEGDPFARDRGREYLLGLGQIREAAGSSTGLGGRIRMWRNGQRLNERPKNLVSAACLFGTMPSSPHGTPIQMHIYHFGHYEASASKRLMGRYVTREAEVDCLLHRRPRVRAVPFAQEPGETASHFAVRVVDEVEAIVRAIHGPPGSGKTSRRRTHCRTNS